MSKPNTFGSGLDQDKLTPVTASSTKNLSSYWATDTEKLYVENSDRTAWVEVPLTGGGATTLSQLSDVQILLPPTGGQVLAYDSDLDFWHPATISGGGTLDDLSDVDTTTVAPTDGQGLVYDSADSTWKPGTIAGGGGGGEPSIFDKILHARGTALDTTYTNGDKVDKLIVSGDMRALVYDRYTNSGTAVNATNATVTVPAGKIAVLLYYEAGDQVLNSASFYRHRLRNITAGTETNPFGNNNISPAGIVSPDGANTALHYPMKVGVAGDVLVMQAWSSGDSNYRTVAGSCVIAFADATTGDWALPAGGGGGGAVAPIGYSASHTLVIGDAEGYLYFTNSASATLTVPPEASVAFPIGTVIYIESAGTGALDIAAGSGVTVNSRGAALTMAWQYAAAQLKKVASDTWTVLGDVS